MAFTYFFVNTVPIATPLRCRPRAPGALENGTGAERGCWRPRPRPCSSRVPVCVRVLLLLALYLTYKMYRTGSKAKVEGAI
jgi:hypothetical protein